MSTNHKKLWLVNIYYNPFIIVTQYDNSLFDHFEISLANPLTTLLHLISIEKSDCIKMIAYRELALGLGLILETYLRIIY